MLLPLVTACFLAPDSSEPAPEDLPSPSTAAAHILLVSGNVQLSEPDGTPLPPTEGHPLHRSVRIDTGTDGMIIVHLANQRLVRLDSELHLPLHDLALFDASTTTVSAEEQLRQLLEPEELDAHGRAVEEANQRVAGWHARVQSAHRPSASVPEAAAAPAEAPAMEMEDGFGDDSLTRPPPPSRSARPRAARGPGLGGLGSSSRGGGGGAPASGLGLETGSSAGGGGAPPEKSAERAYQEVPTNALQTCFQTYWDELDLPAATVEFDLDFVDGKVVRVRHARGLPLPACAVPLVIGTSRHAWPDEKVTVEVD